MWGFQINVYCIEEDRIKRKKQNKNRNTKCFQILGMNIRVHWETLGKLDISTLLVVKIQLLTFSDIGGWVSLWEEE